MSNLRVEPYLISGALILAALAGAALVSGWWAVIRSADLVERVDNPRRSIAERYVQRGSLVDRSGNPISRSVGISGDFKREYLFPGLAATTGYSHPVYGLSGLEQSYDAYLRGTQGNPSMSIWTNQLLYGQPPKGLDIRLSIDIEIQRMTDKALTGKKGAVVLMNAQTGEILALSSQPGFDPNTLDENWLTWTTSKNSPLINRATQGAYPIGTAINPFVLAAQPEEISLKSKPEQTTLDGFGCALSVPDSPTWGETLIAGCPGTSLDLLDHMPNRQLEDIYEASGFFSLPDVLLPQVPAETMKVLDRKDAILGSHNARVSPLQMVLAASALTNNGDRPAPRIAMAVNTPAQGWVILPAGQKIQAYNTKGIKLALTLMADESSPYWRTTASVPTRDGQVFWFVAGTTPEWQGTPFALAIIMEEGTAKSTTAMGLDLLNSVMLQ